MVCEKCKTKMDYGIEGCVQGWRCPACGWSILTTYFDDIELDMTEYSLYINNERDISKEKIKFIAQIANVNYVTAKQMLEKEDAYILKANAPEMKETIIKLQELGIGFRINPLFKYQF